MAERKMKTVSIQNDTLITDDATKYKRGAVIQKTRETSSELDKAIEDVSKYKRKYAQEKEEENEIFIDSSLLEECADHTDQHVYSVDEPEIDIYGSNDDDVVIEEDNEEEVIEDEDIDLFSDSTPSKITEVEEKDIIIEDEEDEVVILDEPGDNTQSAQQEDNEDLIILSDDDEDDSEGATSNASEISADEEGVGFDEEVSEENLEDYLQSVLAKGKKSKSTHTSIKEEEVSSEAEEEVSSEANDTYEEVEKTASQNTDKRNAIADVLTKAFKSAGMEDSNIGKVFDSVLDSVTDALAKTAIKDSEKTEVETTLEPEVEGSQENVQPFEGNPIPTVESENDQLAEEKEEISVTDETLDDFLDSVTEPEPELEVEPTPSTKRKTKEKSACNKSQSTQSASKKARPTAPHTDYDKLIKEAARVESKGRELESQLQKEVQEETGDLTELMGDLGNMENEASLKIDPEQARSVKAVINALPSSSRAVYQKYLDKFEYLPYKAESNIQTLSDSLSTLESELTDELKVLSEKRKIKDNLLKTLVETGVYYVEVENKEYADVAIPKGAELIVKGEHLYCAYRSVPDALTGYRKPVFEFISRLKEALSTTLIVKGTDNISLVDENQMNILTINEFKEIVKFLDRHNIAHTVKNDALSISS